MPVIPALARNRETGSAMALWKNLQGDYPSVRKCRIMGNALYLCSGRALSDRIYKAVSAQPPQPCEVESAWVTSVK